MKIGMPHHKVMRTYKRSRQSDIEKIPQKRNPDVVTPSESFKLMHALMSKMIDISKQSGQK